MQTQLTVLRVELEEIREIFKMMEMMICIVKSCVLRVQVAPLIIMHYCTLVTKSSRNSVQPVALA
jgi:hypothetical protein